MIIDPPPFIGPLQSPRRGRGRLLHQGSVCVALLGAASLAALVTAASSAAPTKLATRSPLAGLDTFLAATMKDWKMPGTAVAVVKEGQVVLLEAYGLRDLEAKLPVTPRTIFPIASITKSFTVAALASLAADGKLDWDKPVHEMLPGFRLYDDVATLRVTPRDLVTHRTGLPRHDAMWYMAGTSTGSRSC
jgi:CubicO group peptidase (beta-lactamase class C family)